VEPPLRGEVEPPPTVAGRGDAAAGGGSAAERGGANAALGRAFFLKKNIASWL